MRPRTDSPAEAERLAAWRRLAAGGTEVAALLAEIAAAGEATPALVARLRRRHEAPLVAAALALVAGRAKAAGKFPAAAGLWCDPQGVEQASSAAVAAWKARRFAGAKVVDLCCGIGGDAMALAAVAAEPPTVVDRDPVRAWMAATNAGGRAEAGEVLAWAEGRDLGEALVHLDPARRDERGGRSFDPEACDPPLSASLRLVRAARGGAIKLSPGIPLPLPGLGPDEELEFVSEEGHLVQAVVWSGTTVEAPGQARATRLAGGTVATVVGTPGPVPGPERGPGRGPDIDALVVPDPSLERARLLHLTGMPELAEGLGLLAATGASPPGLAPFLRRYRVLERLAPREAAVRAALRRRGAAGARVRTRGRSADADRWTKAVRTGESGAELDLFLLRLGDRLVAFVAEPEPA